MLMDIDYEIYQAVNEKEKRTIPLPELCQLMFGPDYSRSCHHSLARSIKKLESIGFVKTQTGYYFPVGKVCLWVELAESIKEAVKQKLAKYPIFSVDSAISCLVLPEGK